MCKTQTHVHVVYPVSTDGSSVVAEVVLDCRNSHLTEKNKATIKKWMTTYCFIQCTVWQSVCVCVSVLLRQLSRPSARQSAEWSGGSQQTVWPAPAPSPGAEWAWRADMSGTPVNSAGPPLLTHTKEVSCCVGTFRMYLSVHILTEEKEKTTWMLNFLLELPYRMKSLLTQQNFILKISSRAWRRQADSYIPLTLYCILFTWLQHRSDVKHDKIKKTTRVMEEIVLYLHVSRSETG